MKEETKWKWTLWNRRFIQENVTSVSAAAEWGGHTKQALVRPTLAQGGEGTPLWICIYLAFSALLGWNSKAKSLCIFIPFLPS
jgi:hypothetical protein